jgi:hypothetical protein
MQREILTVADLFFKEKEILEDPISKKSSRISLP